MASMAFKLALFLVGFRSLVCYEIPQMVYDACSFSDVCNRTATKQPPPGEVSCCASCSCREDCGRTLDCCFDSLDKYNLVENGLVSCVQTAILDSENSRGQNVATHFYMVTSCTYLEGAPNQSMESDKCDWDAIESTNGTNPLAPVTDVTTNVTYVHEACAKCNNVHSFVNWNYFYTAQYTPGSDHGSTLWAIESSVGNRLGTKYFVPPISIRKAVKECFPTLRERSLCDESAQDYEVCETLNLPFRQVSYYELLFKNVACYACTIDQKYSITPGQTCTDRKWSRNIFAPNKLTVFIDIKVKEAAMRSEVRAISAADDGTCQLGSIPSQLKNRCLPVYCPEGMVKNGNDCKYLFVFWHAALVRMQVKLVPSPETLLPESIIKGLSSSEPMTTHKWLKVPCAKLKPLVNDINYENTSFVNVTSLIVRLHKIPKNEEFFPSTEVPLYKRCVKIPWLLQFRNKKYKFIPELDAYFDSVQDGRIPRVKGPTTVVKKTFFCRQIRLPLDEVEIGIEEVRILWTNKTLGNNEFYLNDASMLDNTSLNDSSVSVCLDDYMPISAGTENCPYGFESLLAAYLVAMLVTFTSLEKLYM